jgi:SAM-dependent methyltransferase
MAARPTPTPSAVLGVPTIPPAAATRGLTRVRGAVGRLHASMAPPPVRILEGALAMLDHRVLVELCRLGVPDALARPMSIEALAATLAVDAARLERLVRFAATRGWVRIDRRGRVRPTKVTAFLRAEHPGGWRAWVDFAGGDEVVAAVARLGLGDADPFADANGRPFFEWMADHPDRWTVFDDAMAAGARMHALTLHAALDWDGVERVCDVGGGTGQLLAALLDLEPQLSGSVLDLPAVVRRAVEHPRLTTVAGDAFVAVPSGFDLYLLVNVVHDWGDDDAVRLLATAAGGAGEGGRVVIVDNDRPRVPRPDLATSADVLMAALTPGGRERDAAAIGRLAHRAGLRLLTSTPLASGDLAHRLVVERGNAARRP